MSDQPACTLCNDRGYFLDGIHGATFKRCDHVDRLQPEEDAKMSAIIRASMGRRPYVQGGTHHPQRRYMVCYETERGCQVVVESWHTLASARKDANARAYDDPGTAYIVSDGHASVRSHEKARYLYGEYAR